MMETVGKQKREIQMKIRQMLTEFNRNSSQLLEYLPEEIAATKVSLHTEITPVPVTESHFEDSYTVRDDSLTTSVADLTINTTTEDFEFSIDEEKYTYEIEDGIEVIDVEEYELTDDCEEADEISDPREAIENPDTENGYHICEENAKLYSQYPANTEVDAIENFDEFCVPECKNRSKSMGQDTERRLPEWFLQKFRKGLIAPNVVNILNSQRLFVPSQSEDYFSAPSHELCLPLLKIVTGIVLGQDFEGTVVKCHARVKNMLLGVYEIEPTFVSPARRPLPTLDSVGDADAESRAALLLDCLNISTNAKLELFPEEWKLYIVTLMYWRKNCKHAIVNESHIRALVMCLIYLSVVDRKIGFARSAPDLKKIRKKRLQELRSGTEGTNVGTVPNDESVVGEAKHSDGTNVGTVPNDGVVVGEAKHSDGTNVGTFPKDYSVVGEAKHSDGTNVGTFPKDDSVVGETKHSDGTNVGTFPKDDSVVGEAKNRDETVSSDNFVAAGTKNRDETGAEESLFSEENSVVGNTKNGGESVVAETKSSRETGATESLFLGENRRLRIDDILSLIHEEDCFRAADALLNYHKISENLLQNRKEFNLKLVHSFAQLQHCIQIIGILNSVLNFPFEPCQPHAVFSGTFLYNFYSEMHKRKLGDGYVTRTLLAKANTIISLYRYVITSWEALTSTKVVRPKLEIKKKKSKTKKCNVPAASEKENYDADKYNDPYNIFSMLPEE